MGNNRITGGIVLLFVVGMYYFAWQIAMYVWNHYRSGVYAAGLAFGTWVLWQAILEMRRAQDGGWAVMMQRYEALRKAKVAK